MNLSPEAPGAFSCCQAKASQERNGLKALQLALNEPWLPDTGQAVN